jgi:hypothetical protein
MTDVDYKEISKYYAQFHELISIQARFRTVQILNRVMNSSIRPPRS